jgi:WD40 repeat protein
LAWSPDGKRIVTAPSYDNATTVRARVWDAETGKLVGSLERRQEFFGGVIAHAINRDGSRLATADSNGTVRVWDAKTGKESVVFTRARNISQLGASFHWNPNGDMVVASVGATSVLWDAVAVREVARLEGHPWEIDRVAWSPDGARLATSDRATVLVWDAKTGKNLATLVHRDAEGVADPADDKKQVIHGVAWNPTGTRLATAADGTLRLWDPATGKELTVLAGQAGELSSVVWTADGARFVAAGPDPRVKDAAKGRPVFASEFGWHYSPLEQARRGPDRFRLAPNSDFSLQVTDARTGKEVSVRVFGGHQRRPLDGPNRWWSPDGSRIAALEGTDTVRLWDAATGKALEWLTPSNWFSVHSAAWSPDGTRIVVTGLDSATRLLAQDTPLARVWEVPSAKPEGFGRTATVSAVLKGHTGKIHSATWNRDGRKLVTTSADGTARLYDAATGAEEAVLGGHAGEWIAAAWSPDGSRVATSSDNTVRIWDASTGAELLILVGERVGDLHQTGAPSVRWSPDGWRVSLAPPWSGHEPENGALTIWDATPLDRPAIPPEVAPPPRAKP